MIAAQMAAVGLDPMAYLNGDFVERSVMLTVAQRAWELRTRLEKRTAQVISEEIWRPFKKG